MSAEALFREAESADELFGLFAGAASMCWSNPGGAGEFDSALASVIVDAALDRLVELGWFGPRRISSDTGRLCDRATSTKRDNEVSKR